MNEIASFFRAGVNIIVSGILLMIAIINFNWIFTSPPEANPLGSSVNSIASWMVYAGLVFITGLFAFAFWQRRSQGNSNTTCAMLNALACGLLVVAAVNGAIGA